MGNHLNKKLREVTTRLNMLVEHNAVEKYPRFTQGFELIQDLKIYVAYTWSLAFLGSEHQTSWKRKKETNKQKNVTKQRAILTTRGRKLRSSKLRVFSKSQNWPAGLWQDRSFWKRNRLFPRVFAEKPSPSCILFRVWLIWPDSFDYSWNSHYNRNGCPVSSDNNGKRPKISTLKYLQK